MAFLPSQSKDPETLNAATTIHTILATNQFRVLTTRTYKADSSPRSNS